MQVSFDEMYDEMLQAEFSSRGKHAEHVAHTGHDTVAAPELDLEARRPRAPRGRVGRTDPREPSNRMCVPVAAEEAPAEGEGPRGLARYRNAAMVGAGGLACAAVGAFLGGLGGYFTVNPAAAHSVGSSATAPESAAGRCGQRRPTGAVDGERLRGGRRPRRSRRCRAPLTQGIAPLQWLDLPEPARSRRLRAPAALADLPGRDGGHRTGRRHGAASAASGPAAGLHGRDRPTSGWAASSAA